jgi:DNA-binding transcriptional regulator PaaX
MTPDPLDLLLCETAEMDRRMQADDQKQWKLLFFGTLAIAVLVLRLPGIVLKEQVPKVKNLIVAVSVG